MQINTKRKKMSIRRYKINSGLIAADGSATAYSTGAIRGRILAVHVNYPTNTCTVDLDEQDTQSNQKIMDIAAANTDVVVNPRTAVQDITGADVTYDGTRKIYEPFTVFGRVKLTIASGTEGEEVKVDLMVEE